MPSLDGIQKATRTAVPTPIVRRPRTRVQQRSAPHASSNDPRRLRAMRIAVGVVMLLLIAGWIALFGRSDLRTSSSQSVNPFRAFAERISALFNGTTPSASQPSADEEHLRQLRASVFPEFERIVPEE